MFRSQRRLSTAEGRLLESEIKKGKVVDKKAKTHIVRLVTNKNTDLICSQTKVGNQIPNHRSYSSFLTGPAGTGFAAFRPRKRFKIRFTKRIMGIYVSITIRKGLMLMDPH